MSFDRCSDKMRLNSLDWEEMDIVDVCDSIVDCVNKTAPTVEHTTIYKMIRTTNVKKGNIDLVSVKYVSEDVYKVWTRRSIPQIGDVILTREAPIGEVGIVKTEEKIFLGQRLIQFRANKKILNSRFLLYSMKAPFMQKQIQSYEGTGSTVSHIRVPDCLKFKIKVPDLSIQNNISYILGSLDEKIELNNRMNKVLEQMAQVIFKQWFVDFEFPNENGDSYKSSRGEMVWCEELGKEIPMGWKTGLLSHYLNVKYGKDHKKLADGTIPVYGSGGIMRFVDKALYMTESVLIPRKGTLSNVMYVSKPFWSVDTMFFTEMKFNSIAKFIYLFMKTKDLSSMNVGSAVPSMTTTILNNLDIVISPLELLEKFDEIISPLFEQIEVKQSENEVLSSLRDTLLPKLMSGEIDVSKVEL